MMTIIITTIIITTIIITIILMTIIIVIVVIIMMMMIKIFLKDTSRPSSWPGKSLSSDPVVAGGEMPVVVNVGGIR